MARSYRFGDATRPGLLLGLPARQAVPVIAGAVFASFAMMAAAPLPVVAAAPAAAVVYAFGRWKGVQVSEAGGHAARLLLARWTGGRRWVRPSLLGAGPGWHNELPGQLDGLELIEAPAPWLARETGVAVVHDRKAATVTAVIRARGRGFALASPGDKDAMLAPWGAALASFARERSPVSRVCWHERAHTAGEDAHDEFLQQLGVHHRRSSEPVVDDYLGLVERQGARSVDHEVLIAVTVDQRRVRARTGRSVLEASVEVLLEETRLFAGRLGSDVVTVEPALSPAELTSTIRIWSDPTQVRQVNTLRRSLAAACGRGSIEWGPMAVEVDWTHVKIDRSCHRTYRIATWPPVPVAAHWLHPLLTCSAATRTITVIFEPVPIAKAARSAEREVSARESDHDEKARRGFRVSARDRKRLAQAEGRETELADGHGEFRFVGLVDVAAPTLAELHDAAARVEDAAAQSFLDLRALEARHDLGWVASLPLGRNLKAHGELL